LQSTSRGHVECRAIDDHRNGRRTAQGQFRRPEPIGWIVDTDKERVAKQRTVVVTALGAIDLRWSTPD